MSGRALLFWPKRNWKKNQKKNYKKDIMQLFSYKYRTIPPKFFNYTKNRKYGGKNRLDIYKYRTVKNILGRTPISTVLIIEC